MIYYEAYLDDFDYIVVERHECDKKQDIIFLLHDGENFETLLNVKSEIVEDCKQRFHLKSKTDLDVSKKYTIYTEQGDYALLHKRGVLHTQKFEDMYYYEGKLGNFYTKNMTEFFVWSPTAENILVALYYPRSEKIYKTVPMQRQSKGVWHTSVEGDLECYSYNYYVETNDQIQIAQDPYAISSSKNNIASYIINEEKLLTRSSYDFNKTLNKAIIYETSLRDFSSDEEVHFKSNSYYTKFVEKGVVNKYNDPVGFDYLTSLGITHVQLMPVFYFGSLDEYSEFTNYNWGYDTMHHNVISGLFSSDANDPYIKIFELKNLIHHCHENNIGVTLDVVYNHVYEREKFCYDKIIPWYFYRFDENYNYSNGTGVGNDLATERKMVSRYIVDSTTKIFKFYDIDGMRFDLMGILDTDTMNQIREHADSLDKQILLYGEGWNLNTNLEFDRRSIEENAQKIKDIGFFNGYFRDLVKGSTFDYDDTGIAGGNKQHINKIENVLLGYTPNPLMETNQILNYVSVHDNHTLYDRFKMNFEDASIIHNVRNCFNILAVAQGGMFIHSGSEFLRTKQGIDNSYNKPDSINKIDWRLSSSHKNLVEYIKKLIKLRKYLDDYLFYSREEVAKNCEVYQENDIVIYKINSTNQLSIYLNISFGKVYLHSRNCEGECIMINDTLDYENKIKLDQTIVIEPGSIAVFEKRG